MKNAFIESTEQMLRELGCDDFSTLNEQTELLGFIASSSKNDMVANRATQSRDAGRSLRMTSPVETSWVGCRLVWKSTRTRFARNVAVISSRLGRKLDCNDAWFDALRTVVLRTKPRRDQLLIARGTAAESFVRRAAELFGRMTSEIRTPNQNQTILSWIREQLLSQESVDDHISLSPQILPGSIQADDIPLRDRALLAMADHVVALQVRRDGNTHELLRRAAQSTHFRPGSLVVHTDLCDPELSINLLDSGLTGLHFIRPDAMPSPGTTIKQLEKLSPNIIPLDSIESERYLSHWTRRPRGAWPDQEEYDFSDELILNLPTKNRSAFSALARIIAQQQLLAGSRSNRSGVPIVSFSAVPIQEWQAYREFRPHRSRWDFEPYGICVDRRWLEDQGGRHVIYGDETDWNAIPDSNRHLFQPRSSTTRNGNSIDWSREREFRCIGDIDLSPLDRNQAIVFVPTLDEAQHLTEFSPWPIAVLNQDA